MQEVLRWAWLVPGLVFTVVLAVDYTDTKRTEMNQRYMSDTTNATADIDPAYSEMNIADAWDAASFLVHRNAVAHGWWDAPRNDGEAIALIHSEASEALEAMRAGNPLSRKVPAYSSVEEELADVVIRIMDLAAGRGWDIGGAIEAKHEHNRGRPHKHGGKAF